MRRIAETASLCGILLLGGCTHKESTPCPDYNSTLFAIKNAGEPPKICKVSLPGYEWNLYEDLLSKQHQFE